MEPETTQQEEAREEKHYGRTIAIIIVGVLVVVGVVYGVFLGGLAKKTTYIASEKKIEISSETTTPPPPQVPVETFVMVDTSKTNTPVKATDSKILKAPTNFKSFTYDAGVGKTISVSGACHDTYYVLLIFDAKDDYRTNPGAARSNRAFECGASKLFTIKMDLRDINLPSGNYYLFVADQGKTGSWYNPR
ncbi:MAG: hypothetical protein HY228_00165 [Candidatus Yonathbacteria bacterium]|nr:hypothetical protein [Candidatus Yonathbacteria bacterium]